MSPDLQRLTDYLKEQYNLEPSDLALPEQARGAIIGAHEVIGTIEDIALNGFPTHEDEETTDEH